MIRRLVLALLLLAVVASPAAARLVQIERAGKPVWVNVPEPAGTKLPSLSWKSIAFRDVIDGCAARHAVDPRLVEAVIACESDFDTRATSSAGAMGLMQLMPETANALGIDDAFDVEANVEGGTRHLAGLLRAFGGDQRLAVAAYNAGEGTVRRAGGIPPIPETLHYVRKIEHYLALLGGDFPTTTSAPVSVASLDAPAIEPAEGIVPAEIVAPDPQPPARRGVRVTMGRDASGRLVFVNAPSKGAR